MGTDDTANFLSAMATILDNSKNTPKVNFRHDNKHDKATASKFLKDWSKKLNFELEDIIEHDDLWSETNMILDTYTMMSWPDKGLEGALNEIKLRVDSLAINGSLVLVYPTDNTIEKVLII